MTRGLASVSPHYFDSFHIIPVSHPCWNIRRLHHSPYTLWSSPFVNTAGPARRKTAESDCHSSHRANIQWHSHEPIKTSKTILHPGLDRRSLVFFTSQKSPHIVILYSTKTTSQHTRKKAPESGHVCILLVDCRGCDQRECMHPWALMIRYPLCPCLKIRALIFSSCSSCFRFREWKVEFVPSTPGGQWKTVRGFPELMRTHVV